MLDDLSPALSSALSQRGFTALTSIQERVLDPALAGRDLRIASQTDSTWIVGAYARERGQAVKGRLIASAKLLKASTP